MTTIKGGFVACDDGNAGLDRLTPAELRPFDAADYMHDEESIVVFLIESMKDSNEAIVRNAVETAVRALKRMQIAPHVEQPDREREAFVTMLGIFESTATGAYEPKRLDAQRSEVLRLFDAARAKPAQAVTLPFRKTLERDIDNAENPRGMSVHDGMVRVHASQLRYMLAVIDAHPPSPASASGDTVAKLVAALRGLVNASDALGEAMFYGDGDDDEVRDAKEDANDALDVAREAIAAAGASK